MVCVKLPLSQGRWSNNEIPLFLGYWKTQRFSRNWTFLLQTWFFSAMSHFLNNIVFVHLSQVRVQLYNHSTFLSSFLSGKSCLLALNNDDRLKLWPHLGPPSDTAVTTFLPVWGSHQQKLTSGLVEFTLWTITVPLIPYPFDSVQFTPLAFNLATPTTSTNQHKAFRNSHVENP